MGTPTVVVIGGGVGGLTALKNFRDENFDVTLFEKRDSLGGVWEYSSDKNITTTLQSTLSNVTRYRNCFTDFPAPKTDSAYLTAPEAAGYIKSYAEHFGLLKYIHLNTEVLSIMRNDTDTKWEVKTRGEKGEKTRTFDKVLVANGLIRKPNIPKVDGLETFKGKIVHSIAYKTPIEFKDLRVLVVGFGNTAADTSTTLVGHASKIYVSHRSGGNIFSRNVKGKPLDVNVPLRDITARNAISRYIPPLASFLFNALVRDLSLSSFPSIPKHPEWRIYPAPSIEYTQPIISDDLVQGFLSGDITSVHGISKVLGPNRIELLDGTTVDVDAIIFCTGYLPDFSIIPNQDPMAAPTAIYRAKGYNGPPLVDLYQNIFSPAYPTSLGYLSFIALTEGVMTAFDLASMAIAQVFAEKHSLPPQASMEAEIKKHHSYVVNAWHKSNKQYGGTNTASYTGFVQEGPWIAWLNEVARTGVNEKLGYGWAGWKFWVGDRRFCNLLMGGVMSGHMYRVFETQGGRKSWEGAREAIEKANEDSKRFIK